ncbi:hypothetical protein GOODEAATRI_018306 [Goodea atripinnis]|uniref:Uncharacterized protein n=1 Tax=Goodea atripinnis TaxID=208336 RepID=A0ABV0NVN1_9TELE
MFSMFGCLMHWILVSLSLDLRWFSHIDNVLKKVQQRLRQLKSPTFPRSCWSSSPLPSSSLSCLHPSQSGLDHPPNRTGPDCNQQSSRTYTGQGSGTGQLTSLQTPHTLHTDCLGFDLQVALQSAVC